MAVGCGSQGRRLYAEEGGEAQSGALALATTPPWLWEAPAKGSAIPKTPEAILGTGKIKSEDLARFLIKTNPFIDKDFAEEFAAIYVEESDAEGVNHDIAFSQMCLETGFLSFGGLVEPEMHNYCGLGSTGPDKKGESFSSPRMGVRAQIQHLKVYATNEPLNNKNVDPRYMLVKPGSASTIYELAGLWAEDKDYGKKLKAILERLYVFTFIK